MKKKGEPRERLELSHKVESIKKGGLLHVSFVAPLSCVDVVLNFTAKSVRFVQSLVKTSFSYLICIPIDASFIEIYYLN